MKIPKSIKPLNRQAQVWVSAVLYILIISIALVLVLNVGIPLMDHMKDKTAYTRTRDTMLSLDQHIEDVTSEGEGSQRIVAVEIKEGELNMEDGSLSWEFKTDSDIIEPRSKIEYGNLVVSSDIDVIAKEYDTFYTLENSYLLVNISMFNSTPGNTSDLINSVYFKPNDVTIPGNFSFQIGTDADTATGIITTSLVPPGNNTALDFATVVVQVNASGITYDLELSLESQADFITTRITNVY